MVYIICYLIGTITFGSIFAKILKKDIRSVGSGNIGATNATRAMGWGIGAIVAALDLFKGLAILWVVPWLVQNPTNEIWAISALAVVLGHVFPFWQGFKGGKGVATAAGVMLIFTPINLLIAVALFVIIVLLTRLVSFASILSTVWFVIAYFVQTNMPNSPENLPISLIMILIPALLIFTHRGNIKRLITGEEKETSFSKRGKS